MATSESEDDAALSDSSIGIVPVYAVYVGLGALCR